MTRNGAVQSLCCLLCSGLHSCSFHAPTLSTKTTEVSQPGVLPPIQFLGTNLHMLNPPPCLQPGGNFSLMPSDYCHAFTPHSTQTYSHLPATSTPRAWRKQHQPSHRQAGSSPIPTMQQHSLDPENIVHFPTRKRDAAAGKPQATTCRSSTILVLALGDCYVRFFETTNAALVAARSCCGISAATLKGRKAWARLDDNAAVANSAALAQHVSTRRNGECACQLAELHLRRVSRTLLGGDQTLCQARNNVEPQSAVRCLKPAWARQKWHDMCTQFQACPFLGTDRPLGRSSGPPLGASRSSACTV